MKPKSKQNGHYDHYVKWHHQYPDTELWYLSELTLAAAIELDNLILGIPEDFSSVKEFAYLIGSNEESSYKLKPDDKAISLIGPFPYLLLMDLIKGKLGKKDQDIEMEELTLEINLFYLELINSPKLLPQRTLECISNETGEGKNYGLSNEDRKKIREEIIQRRYEGVKYELSREKFDRNIGKLEDMVHFLCGLSSKFSYEDSEKNTYRLTA